MSSQRKVLLSILLVAAIAVVLYRASVFSQPEQEFRPSLVVVTGGSGPYWQAIASGAKAAAGEVAADVDVRMPDRDEDLESQSNLLHRIDTSVVDGVSISPLDAEAQTRMIDRLAEGALVLTIDSDAPLSDRVSYVGASNLAAGKKAAELAKEAVPDGGKIAVLLANLSKDNMLERKAGFQQELIGGDDDQAMSNDSYEIVGYFIDEGDNERCANQIGQLLDEHDDLACIVGMNARHGPILLSSLKAADKLGEIKIVTFDTPDETLNGIKDGHIYATIAQDPYQYGYEAVCLLASYCRRPTYELPPRGNLSTMTINTTIVRQEDVDEFRRTRDQRPAGGPAVAK